MSDSFHNVLQHLVSSFAVSSSKDGANCVLFESPICCPDKQNFLIFYSIAAAGLKLRSLLSFPHCNHKGSLNGQITWIYEFALLTLEQQMEQDLTKLDTAVHMNLHFMKQQELCRNFVHQRGNIASAVVINNNKCYVSFSVHLFCFTRPVIFVRTTGGKARLHAEPAWHATDRAADKLSMSPGKC